MPNATQFLSAAPAPAKRISALAWHPRSFAAVRADRFFNLVDLVNQLEQENAAGRSGRLAETLLRYDVIVIDELGYLPFSQSGGHDSVPSDQQALREHLAAHHHQSGGLQIGRRFLATPR